MRFFFKWTINRNLTSVLPTKCYSGDQLKKNEMGGARDTYVGELRTGFWWGKLGEGGHVEDLGIDG